MSEEIRKTALPIEDPKQFRREGETIQKRAITKKEFARAFSISEASVSKRLRLGHIRKIKLGSGTRIPIEEIERIAKEGFPQKERKSR